VPASSEDRFAPRGALRSALYKVSWAAISGFDKASRACLQVAAGLLREDELREIGYRRASLFAAPEEYTEAGLEPWEERVYLGAVRDGDHVLVIGCGGGRELLALGARGVRVTGVDPVPALVDAARRHLARRRLTATLIAAPVEDAVLPDRYDVVIFSACVYGYLPGAASRLSTLMKLRAHMTSDGRLVASYADGAGSRSGVWLTRVVARLARTGWLAGPEDSFARGPVRQRLPFYERRMSPSAVRGELMHAGFDVVRDEPVASWRCAVAAARV
jgi:SAM-dependent methyltransferase